VKLSKEVKVGLLALIAGVILYVGFNFLKGTDFFSSKKKYYIIYKDVDGLTASNSVLLHGLSVGRVHSIRLLPQRDNLILVSIEVEGDVVLGDATVAVLTSSDLLGGKNIDLRLGKNTSIYKTGDTLKGYRDKPFTEILEDRAMPILTNLDSTVQKVNKIFGDQLGNSIQTTLHNFEIASNDLRGMVKENRKNINVITTNVADLTTSLAETEKALKPLMVKLNAVADTINDLNMKRTIAKANTALQNLQDITAKINSGQGTLGLLVNDKSMYQNLDQSIKDLDKLMLDLQKNPKRYVHFSLFGGKDKTEKTAVAAPASPAPVNK